ncbi:MAG: M56 family metallopeptidase [Gemmatimonadaceae bacterium]
MIFALGLLLDAALKGTILIAAAALAAYLLRSHSAAARHAAWTAAVVGHLALPAVTLLAPAWRLPFLPAPPWLESTVTGNPQLETSPRSSTATGQQPVPPSQQSAPSSQFPVSKKTAEPTPTSTVAQPFPLKGISLFAALWIVGVVIVLLRLAFGTMQVGKLARRGSRVVDGAWLSLAQRVAGVLGINRPLTLLHGDRLGIPVTWGVIYPAVLLPPDAEEWPEERRRFVLVHEMAHVKRFDALTQLAAQIAIAIFWFDPFIWLAAHRMRVEREHACDDYVLRDGTKPSLYAGELLEMVRTLGTPSHERAAPAFAALAMARRSEFEGRMLAILDPKLDRHTLDRRSTLVTAAIVALLVIPLAALRPFEQARQSPPTLRVANNKTAIAAAPTAKTPASCDDLDLNRLTSTSTHISVNDDDETGARSLWYLESKPGRCAEGRMLGRAKLSSDETRLLSLPQGGVARFREVRPGIDRSIIVIPEANGLSYTARVNGRIVDADASIMTWLSKLMPEVLRESAVDVPQRVARFRQDGGVDNVLALIARIHSTASRAAHFRAFLDADDFSQDEIDRIASAAGRDLASSPSDLKAVVDMMSPLRHSRGKYPSTTAKAAINQSIQTAILNASSSTEKASLLTQYALGGDQSAILMALQGARELTSDYDKSSFLTTVAASALTARNPEIRHAYFGVFGTLGSDYDGRNVLIAAIPYAHANPAITTDIINGTLHLNASSDKADVLVSVATQQLITTPEISRQYLAAAKKIESSYDYKRVLQAAIQQ